jgi:hypothetical protein
MKSTSRKSAKSTSASTRKSTRENSAAQKAAVARHRLDPQMKIVSLVEGNPRREKSLGHKSFEIIVKARKPMTVETFVEKGGRLRDLHWDVNAKNVKLVRKAG